MDSFLFYLGFGLGLALFRFLRYRCCLNLHVDRFYGWVVQWYTVFAAGLFVKAVWCSVRVFQFEFVKFNLLDPVLVAANLNKMEANGKRVLTPQDLLDLEIPPKLRTVSLIGYLAGVLAVFVGVISVIISVNAMTGRRYRLAPLMGIRWQPSAIQDMGLFVIFVPGVTALMAMTSQVRLWTLMTGSAWKLSQKCPTESGLFSHAEYLLNKALYGTGRTGCEYSWHRIKSAMLADCTLNLEFIEVYHYIAIFAFVQLCVAFFVSHQVTDPTAGGTIEAFCKNERGAGQTVTKEVNELISLNGAHDFTAGQPLQRLIDLTDELKTGSVKLLLRRGRYNIEIPTRLCCATRLRYSASLLLTDDHIWSLKWSGLLGAWTYIIVGCLRSGYSLLALWLSMNNESLQEQYQLWTQPVVQWINSLFPVLALFCVVNVGLVTKMKDIQSGEALGRTSLIKVIPTLVLVFVSDTQMLFFAAWVPGDGTPTPPTRAQDAGSFLASITPTTWRWYIDALTGSEMSIYQAKLWHASFLCMWAAVMAMVSLRAWVAPYGPLEEEDLDGYQSLSN